MEKNWDQGSGINIVDPQHCQHVEYRTSRKFTNYLQTFFYREYFFIGYISRQRKDPHAYYEDSGDTGIFFYSGSGSGYFF